MAAEASAYAALGLEPGADAAEIERAYKRLIKAHHPDRAGGDARRAAEINRAYRELRSAAGYKEALEFNGDATLSSDDSVRSAILLLLAAAAFGILLVAGPLRGLAPPFSASSSPSVKPDHDPRRAGAADAIDQPLVLPSVERGIRDALRIARTEDELALAMASRKCHRRLHSDPSIAQLDRCAAFDDAVIEIQDRDPLRDRGPFAELAVTGRLMSGGTLFSDDYLAIDTRLDRIRLRVELAFAPPPLPPVVEAPAED